MRQTTRESLAIEMDVSLPRLRVITLLEPLRTVYGRPRQLSSDNGSKCMTDRKKGWSLQHGVRLQFIESGKLHQNAYIERFNKGIRTDVLGAWVFASLAKVRDVIET